MFLRRPLIYNCKYMNKKNYTMDVYEWIMDRYSGH